MRFDSMQLKRTLIVGAFIALVVWSSLLTQKSSQHNQSLVSLNQTISSNESTINYQRVNEKLTELSEQLTSVHDKNSEWVMQGQLAEVQDELRSRIQQLSRQFDSAANNEQLYKLQAEVTTQVEKLNEQLKQLSAEITLIKNNVPQVKTTVTPTTSNKSKSTTQNAPFTIQGKELRAGEWVISVLPIKQKNIESSVLLIVGQRFGSWQLVTIEERHAVFSIGNQKRRLAIPTL